MTIALDYCLNCSILETYFFGSIKKHIFTSLRGKSLTLLNSSVQWYFSLEIEERADTWPTRAGWLNLALRDTLPARSTVLVQRERRKPVRSGGPRAGLIYTGQRLTARLSPDAHSSYPCPVRNHFQLIYSEKSHLIYDCCALRDSSFRRTSAVGLLDWDVLINFETKCSFSVALLVLCFSGIL